MEKRQLILLTPTLEDAARGNDTKIFNDIFLPIIDEISKSHPGVTMKRMTTVEVLRSKEPLMSLVQNSPDNTVIVHSGNGAADFLSDVPVTKIDVRNVHEYLGHPSEGLLAKILADTPEAVDMIDELQGPLVGVVLKFFKD